MVLALKEEVFAAAFLVITMPCSYLKYSYTLAVVN